MRGSLSFIYSLLCQFFHSNSNLREHAHSFVHLSVRPSLKPTGARSLICPSVCPSVPQTYGSTLTHLSICLSVRQSVSQTYRNTLTHLSICLSVHPSVCKTYGSMLNHLSICLSVRHSNLWEHAHLCVPSARPSLSNPTGALTHLSVRPSFKPMGARSLICPYVCQSVSQTYRSTLTHLSICLSVHPSVSGWYPGRFRGRQRET